MNLLESNGSKSKRDALTDVDSCAKKVDMSDSKVEIVDLGHKIYPYPKTLYTHDMRFKKLFDGFVAISEKVDGLNVYFGKYATYNAESGVFTGYKLQLKTEYVNIDIDEFEKTGKTRGGFYDLLIRVVKTLENKLHPNWTYRCVYLEKPSHYGTMYDRVPNHHIALFDVNEERIVESIIDGVSKYRDGNYIPYYQVDMEARALGLESVPLLYYGNDLSSGDNCIITGSLVDVSHSTILNRFLRKISFLCKDTRVAGLYVKNYGQRINGVSTADDLAIGEVMNTKTYGIGRDVNKNNSDKSDNKGDNSDNGVVITKITPSNREIVTRVLSEYKMEEHYVDAFKRLDDSRELDYTPKDIGKLIKLIVTDITETECENIKNVLFKFVAPHIKKGAVSGLCEWYRNKLVELAAEKEKELQSIVDAEKEKVSENNDTDSARSDNENNTEDKTTESDANSILFNQMNGE